MQLHDLKAVKAARSKKVRVGRGSGSGCGKTSTRGVDGQKKRSNPRIRPYFEGGAMPLIRKIPKRGFRNTRFAKKYQIVNVADLNRLKTDEKVNPDLLKRENLITSTKRAVKILGEGILEKKLQVYAHAFSKTAKDKIESSGGKIIILKR